MFTTDLVFSLRYLGLIIGFTVKLSLKDYVLIILFLNLGVMFFFLALEAITIAAVNCKTSFMRGIYWHEWVLKNCMSPQSAAPDWILYYFILFISQSKCFILWDIYILLPCFCTEFTKNWIGLSQSDWRIFSCILFKQNSGEKSP